MTSPAALGLVGSLYNLPPPPKIVLALSSEQIHTYITTGGAGGRAVGGVGRRGGEVESHDRDQLTEYKVE